MWFIAVALVACRHDPELVQHPLATGGTSTLSTSVAGATPSAEVVRQLTENFARVHFPSDSSTLDAEALRALSANAALLRAHRDVRVEIQGHADERGTVDYNLALGQRRGRSVVDALVAEGVAPSRLLLVSYGEERPLAAASGEVAWAENRRAEFRLLLPTPGLNGTTEQ